MFSFKRRPCLTQICAGTIWLTHLFSKTPSEHSFLACRFEYICPLKHHCNIPKPNISELICDAGISPAGTFYRFEYFALFLVLIYLAYRLRTCLGITKQTRVLSCPIVLLKSHHVKMHSLGPETVGNCLFLSPLLHLYEFS